MVIVWRRWHDGVFLAVAVMSGGDGVRDRELHRRPRPPAGRAARPAGAVRELPVRAHRRGGRLLRRRCSSSCAGTRRNRCVRAVFAVVAVAAPLIVGCLAGRTAACTTRSTSSPGSLLGLAALVVVRAALRAGCRGDRPNADGVDARARLRRLDLTEPERRPMTSSHVPRRDRIADRRRARPPPSRRSSPSPGSAGSPRASSTASSASSPCRSPSTGRRSERAERAARRARPAPSPRSPSTSFGAARCGWSPSACCSTRCGGWRPIVLPAENSAKAWVTRVGYLVSAVVYVALAWTALLVRPPPSSARAARARTPRSSGSPAT